MSLHNKAIMVDDPKSMNWARIELLKFALYLPGKVGLQHLAIPDKRLAGVSLPLHLRCPNCP